jgi:hypothetical protein
MMKNKGRGRFNLEIPRLVRNFDLHLRVAFSSQLTHLTEDRSFLKNRRKGIARPSCTAVRFTAAHTEECTTAIAITYGKRA